MKIKRMLLALSIGAIIGFIAGTLSFIEQLTIQPHIIQYKMFRVVFLSLQTCLNRGVVQCLIISFVLFVVSTLLLLLKKAIWRRPTTAQPHDRLRIPKHIIAKTINFIAFVLVVLLLILNIGIIINNIINIPKRPNVILISIDTLRADHLGCYGYSRNTTPHIDAFSKDSVLFKNCIAQAPSTAPSHASIFTSVIPSHHNVSTLKRSLMPPEIVTMAEFLKNIDYKTASYNGGGCMSARFGFAQGFDIYKSQEVSPRWGFRKDIEKDVIGFIENNKENEFFLFLHTYETHHPYTPAKKHLDQFKIDYTGMLPDKIRIPLLKRINNGELKITQQDLDYIISCYDAEIKSMDEGFSLLVNYLKREGIYDNTIIILTSDHGEEFNEHGWVGWHGHTLYDELLKVPLIIKFPHSYYKGKIIDQQVRSIDILPTLLEMLNVDTIDFTLFEGSSLLPLIQTGANNHELYAISQKAGLTTPIRSGIRTNRWKLYNSQLFDLQNDPLEQKDVSKENKKIQSRLTDKLSHFLNKKTYNIKTKKITFDKELSNQLKSLGYLN